MKIKELRIYFECLEQANHYVQPALKSVLKKIGFGQIPVKLVALKKDYSLYSSRIRKILDWKDPDILVSLVTDTGIELPVFMIEFSTAVFTEDHELQRFDGMVAAAENNTVYIKISPMSKTSESDHGGNTNFNFKRPFSLIYQKYHMVPFHIEWASNGSIVEVNDKYLSCPKYSNDFKQVLEIIFNSIKIRKENETEEIGYGIDSSLLEKNTKAKYPQWLSELNSTKNDINSFSKLNTSRLRIINRKYIIIKINRFGHAMDPERGMLVFYSIIFDGNAVSKMVFDENNNAWYKDIPQEECIKEFIKERRLQSSMDFLYVFYSGSGLHKIMKFDSLKKYIIKKNTTIVYLNVSDLITEYWSKLSKPLRTIFKFSKLLRIEDKNGKIRVVLIWKNDILNLHEPNSGISATSLKEIDEIDEDLVTYITVHNVLEPQGYKILAASYPGAQGDRVILVEPRTGRKQPRKYIDVIAFCINRRTSALQSNKGKFSVSKTNKEIKEFRNYKTNPNYKEGLKSFFDRFDKDAIGSSIKIGVGFWLNRNCKSDTLKDVDLSSLDYFLFITKDMKKWYVSRIGNVELLNNYEGNVNIPKIWEPKSGNP